jgi:phytol kinase
MGPIRWIVILVNQSNLQGIEDLIVKGMIGLFVLVSALVSWGATKSVRRCSKGYLVIGFLSSITLLALGSLWFWMNPSWGPGNRSQDSTVHSRFTLGSYPSREKLLNLKQKGYTAVISLLHPAVVPFEPMLLSEEQTAAKEIGIELIHLPMFPWISKNEDPLKRIKEIASSGEGRYYVHCYLGMHRVNIVRQILEQTSIPAIVEGQRLRGGIENQQSFERGPIYKIDDRIYLTPFPTEEEFFTFILNGTVKHVVSLLNPKNSQDVPWIEKEQEFMDTYDMGFSLIPTTDYPYDPYQVLDAIEQIRTLPRPLVVHRFLSGSSRSPVTEALVEGYQTGGLPTLPKSLFTQPMENGWVKILAPNVVSGPQPTEWEFGGLFKRGIRGMVFLDSQSSPDVEADRTTASNTGMIWRQLEAQGPRLADIVSSEGPWYLYGPQLSLSLEEQISANYKTQTLGTLDESALGSRDDETGQKDFGTSLIGLLQEKLSGSVPTTALTIHLSPFLVCYTILSAMLVGCLRVRKGIRTPYTRKIFHFLILTMAGVIHMLWDLPAVTLFGTIVSLSVLYAVYQGDGHPFYEALARPADSPRRTLFIVVPLVTTAVGGIICNLIFAPFAHIGYLVCGWGDAVGEPVGTRWGKHSYLVPSLMGVPANRSLEGSAAVCIASSLAASLALWVTGVSTVTAICVGVGCGIIGTVIEAFSNHGIDNLTIQIAASGAADVLLG